MPKATATSPKRDMLGITRSESVVDRMCTLLCVCVTFLALLVVGIECCRRFARSFSFESVGRGQGYLAPLLTNDTFVCGIRLRFKYFMPLVVGWIGRRGSFRILLRVSSSTVPPQSVSAHVCPCACSALFSLPTSRYIFVTMLQLSARSGILLVDGYLLYFVDIKFADVYM